VTATAFAVRNDSETKTASDPDGDTLLPTCAATPSCRRARSVSKRGMQGRRLKKRACLCDNLEGVVRPFHHAQAEGHAPVAAQVER
jgi:hypothetical protein